MSANEQPEDIGVVARFVEVTPEWGTLQISTNRQAHIDNFNAEIENNAHGQLKVVIYKPSDGDLQRIIDACQGELGRRNPERETASPDMLAAIKQGIAAFQWMRDEERPEQKGIAALDAMEAAVKKAEGQS